MTRKEWSDEICNQFGISAGICPPLIESHDCVGSALPNVAAKTGLLEKQSVRWGADNACGAIGAGILSSGKTLCSIGTSGVILSYEEGKERDFKGKCTFLIMERRFFLYDGVTLGAGYSLDWFKERLHQTNRLSNYCRG